MNTKAASEKWKENVTCGILLHTDRGYLLCHPTGRKHKRGCYDIPKGMKEAGETEWECAVRELREETGLAADWKSIDVKDMGRHRYNEKKDIHLFRCEFPEIETDKLVCSSFVEELGIPETDGWAVTEDLGMCFKSLVRVFKECNIIWV